MSRKPALALLSIALSACAGPKDMMPAFSARSLDGESFSNQSLKGKVVLLQFWTTWCGYCRRDQPAVEDITKQYRDRGLVVLAISVGESRSTVEEYLRKSPRTPKIVLNDNTNLVALFRPESFPAYALLDRDGAVAGTQLGAGGRDSLRGLLRKAGIE